MCNLKFQPSCFPACGKSLILVKEVASRDVVLGMSVEVYSSSSFCRSFTIHEEEKDLKCKQNCFPLHPQWEVAKEESCLPTTVEGSVIEFWIMKLNLRTIWINMLPAQWFRIYWGGVIFAHSSWRSSQCTGLWTSRSSLLGSHEKNGS